jgi:regulatory protein YycH of two-component signal transduction system YycFG
MTRTSAGAPRGLTSLEIVLLCGMVVMLIVGSVQLWKGDHDRAERNALEVGQVEPAEATLGL